MNTITMILDEEEATVIIDALKDAISADKLILQELLATESVNNRDAKIFYERNRIVISESALDKIESGMLAD